MLLLGIIVVAGLGLPKRWCINRVEAAFERGNLSDAARWLDRATSLGGGAELAFASARFERKIGRLDLAEAQLRHAAKMGYDAAAIEFERRLLAAQSGVLPHPEAELANLLVAGDRPNDVAEAFTRGHILAYRLDEAMGLIEIWKDDFPDSPEPRYLAGRVYEHRADYPEAQAEFLAALQVAPDHAPSAYNLARVLLTSRKPEAALEQYETCERTLLEPLPATLGCVKCLRELGRLKEARSKLGSVDRPSEHRLEIAYCIVGDPVEGVAAQLQEEWGRLEMAERNWSAAANHFAAVLQANPRNWRVRYAYATALRQQGKTDEASTQLRLYEEAKSAIDSTDRLVDRLRNDPDDVEARYEMGRVFLEHISENQGLVWLKSVLALEPGHRLTHRVLSEYYASKAGQSPQFARLAHEHHNLAAGAAESPDAPR